MLVLAFDTSHDNCSVAISYNGSLVASELKQMQQGHAENLLPMIERVRSQANISYDALDLIAVTTGPGTFTGVRVGLAAARALSLALDVSLLGVSTLEILARSAKFQIVDDFSGIIASIDARRGQIYMQAFDASAEAITEPVVYTIGTHMALEAIGTGFIVGSGAKNLLSTFPDWRIFEEIRYPDAAFLAITAGHWGDRVGCHPPAPNYLRAPDAKLPTGRKFISTPK